MRTEHTTIHGAVQTYEFTSDKGNTVTSAFRGRCGNPVYKTTTMMPELIVFHAGTLDRPGDYQPQMVFYSDCGQFWDHIDPAVPRK